MSAFAKNEALETARRAACETRAAQQNLRTLAVQYAGDLRVRAEDRRSDCWPVPIPRVPADIAAALAAHSSATLATDVGDNEPSIVYLLISAFSVAETIQPHLWGRPT